MGGFIAKYRIVFRHTESVYTIYMKMNLANSNDTVRQPFSRAVVFAPFSSESRLDAGLSHSKNEYRMHDRLLFVSRWLTVQTFQEQT